MNFAGDVAVGYQEEVSRAPRAFDVDAEAFVRFLKKQHVGGGSHESMAVQAVGALGNGVLDHVEEMATVGGPRSGGHPLGAKREEFAALEILDLQSVLAEAGDVGGIGQKLVVVRDFKGAQAQEAVAFGQGVEVEEQLVRGALWSGRAA